MRSMCVARANSGEYLAVVLALVLIGAAGGARADEVLSENFDSYTAPSDGGFRHSITGGTPDESLVGVTDVNCFSKPNSLIHQVDSPDDAHLLSASTRAFPQGVPIDTSDLIQARFKIRLEQTNTTFNAFLADNHTKSQVRLAFTNNGQVWAMNSTSNEDRTVLGKYEPGKWYQVTITLNLRNSTWDAALADANHPDAAPLMSTTGRTFFQPPAENATMINRITFSGTTGKGLVGKVYIDDLLVQTLAPKE